MKGCTMVIPKLMQGEILERIHEGPQGISKCRERAKSSVWWLSLNNDLEKVVKSCSICLEN